MQMNLGRGDRVARGILGAMILIVSMLMKNSLIAIAGFFVLYESLSSWCVLYQLIGKNTCPVKNINKKSIFKDFYIKGIKILSVAILLNVYASVIGWVNWYGFLNDHQDALSWDNYLFLFLIYPIFLGLFV